MDQIKDTIAALVEKGRVAQAQVDTYSQKQIDEVVLSVAWEVYSDENIEKLAALAVEETGMGNIKDKIAKHKGKVMGVLKDLQGAKSVGLIETDKEKKIRKYAKSVGVVGALTPVTNPTATPASNSLSIIKGRNAVIFAPHPKAKKCSGLAIEFMRKGLKRVGAPEDLIQIIDEPSLDLSNELMRQVDLVLATGGGAMVKAAYSSGTPAYGVGPGNSVEIIAEDADVEDAITKVSLSKVFDNATSCSSENSIIVEAVVYDKAMEELNKKKGFLCVGEDRKKLEDWIWVDAGRGYRVINPKIVAKSAEVIASDAGIEVPAGTKMLLVEGSNPCEEDRFSGEKLSPVLTVWKYSGFEEGLSLLKRITDFAGTGHSCGIHTYKEEYIQELALTMKSSRIMIRQPQAPANGGNFFNGMPSTVTLGCGTWGGNITTENINYKHFLNITWVSEPFAPVRPTDDDIWGEFWKKYQA